MTALQHLAKASALDPRSANTARRTGVALLYLRRYPEAYAAMDRGLALAPTNLVIIEQKAMVALAQGDLPGARAVVRTALSTVDPAALLAFLGNFQDLYWVLDDDQQQQLLTLPPSAFDDDRGTWAIVRAQTYDLRGNPAQARIYADSARLAIEEQLRATPDDGQLHAFRGLALAYLGRKAEAIAEGRRGVALLPLGRDAYTGAYFQHQLARIYTDGRRARAGAGPVGGIAQDPVLPLAGVAPDRSHLRSAAEAPAVPEAGGGECVVTDPLADLRAGLRDRYAIERELGRGGMAVVYLAHDLRHDRPVALKVLHPELAAALGPERFQREIRFAARLQHPHILTVLDSGEAAGRLWFTMPFVEGESLRDRIRRERQLPVDVALQIGREAARALDYAHQHGIVHRDIKPENILLTSDGTTLVADFGIARALEGDDRLTQTGFAIGTPAYMSPEQAAGDKGVDARTDVYSLGAVLYEMLAGEPPFTGPTAQAMIARRLSEPPPSVRRSRPTVPEGVDQAIQRALAPVPADRFASAAELARALQAPGATQAPTAATVEATPATPPTAPGTSPQADTRHRRPVPVLAITLIAGFLLGLGVLFAWRHSLGGGDAASGTGPRVLAVLPFENLGDSTTEYFADGVTDAVRGKLSSLPGLQVIASTSSNEYKDSGKSLPVIARELEADYLLIARIRWAKAADGSSRVKVSPELVDVGRGGAPKVKWQQPFDAEITDVFTVQADIADQVADALDLALGQARSRP